MIPITEIGTDPKRMYLWSKDAAAEANQRVKQMGIDRPPMVDTQDPYGYVSPPLDGIWLRAPYLHNGSVPTLRDLLNPANERPQTFHRGYDVFDPVNVGFKEPPRRPTGRNGQLEQTYPLFDTRERGNGNQGHTYGTELSADEKGKLLAGTSFLLANTPAGEVRSLYGGRKLVAEPVLQFPNPQCGIQEPLGSGRAIISQNLAIDFLCRGTRPLFSRRSRPSVKTSL